jgi:5-methylcytosine-specific restriction enzyme subunit McrC
VLLSGLRLAASLASDRGLRFKAARLADLLGESITPVRLDRQVFQRLAGEMDRMTRQYEPAVSLIRILYDAGGLSLSDGKTAPETSGFLFDMNRFFQTLLEKFLSDNLTEFVVRSELRLTGMFAYLPGWNPRHSQAPTPRPDLVVSQGREPVAILDAKYRDLWENALPRDMLYQLSIYAMSYEGKSATILYPTTHKQAKESRIEIRHPLHGERRAMVVLRPVHLEKLGHLVTARTTPASIRDRQRYAMDLALGS